jgi:2-polyprenyl-3-methyl-5-hydroxy-6-metoxy-1,4-benzoquinol methylase
MISDAYRAQLVELHERDPSWGTSATYWASEVADICHRCGCLDILDYGAGKGVLSQMIEGVRNYDPATFPEEPEPADLVVCIDVLEHVEPDHICAVIDHLARLTRKVCFVVIATREAEARLPDGRNAHLIVMNFVWWRAMLEARFEIDHFSGGRGYCRAVMRPHESFAS